MKEKLPLWQRLRELAAFRTHWTPEEERTLREAIALLKAWEED